MTQRPVVVITGASAGVGRTAAAAFARRGFSVGLLARGVERLEAARQEVDGLGRGACSCPPTWPTPARSTMPPPGSKPSWARSTCGSTAP